MELQALLPFLLPLVPECPRVLALNQLRQAVIDFAKRTYIDARDFAQEVGAGEAVTLLDVGDDGVRVLDVPFATAAGVTLRRASREQLDSRSRGWMQVAGECRAYLPWSGGAFRWYPVPEAATLIEGRAVVVPVLAAMTIGDVYEEYAQALAYGACAQLMMMPAKPWSMPQVAASYHGQFVEAIAEAKLRYAREAVYSPVLMPVSGPAGYFG